MGHKSSAVLLQVGDRRIELVCDWAVIDKMQSDYGVEEYRDRLASILNSMQIEGVADLVSRMSGLSADEIKAASPPLNEVNDAIQRAWMNAWVGSQKIEKAMKEEAREEKKRSRKTLLSWLWKRPSEQV